MGVTEGLLHLLHGLVSQHRADLELLDVAEHQVRPLTGRRQLVLGVGKSRQDSLKLEIFNVAKLRCDENVDFSGMHGMMR